MTHAQAIRVLVVDDHPLLRDGVVLLLSLQPDMTVVGEAGDGWQATEMATALRPDVVLMDLQMPGRSGLEAIRAIRREVPSVRIIVVSTYAGDMQVVQALKAGASGYLLKSTLRNELVETVRAVHEGLRRISPEVANEVALHAGEDALTEREIDVLRLAAGGRANKEIAQSLHLSEDRIKAILKAVYAKLHVSDRTQAVTVALRRGALTL